MTGAESDVRRTVVCRYCGSADLLPLLSLGEQPPSNSFLSERDLGSERRYPLDVVLCRSCFLMQLGHVLSPKLIFGNYLYLSSTSAALQQHYRRLVRELSERFALRPGDVVVDVGCNDGSLLREWDDRLVRVGVEPSQVADIARQSGLDVIKAYFDAGLAERIARAHGTAALVTATNVFPHVDDIDGFTNGLRSLLGRTGVLVIEASYLPDLIDQCLFDTIYHEHLAYLSLTSLVPFLDRHGLRIIDAQRVAVGASGPAIRIFVTDAESSHAVADSVQRLLADEARWGIRRVEKYTAFAARVARARSQLLGFIADLRSRGARIGGYGAPAKGNTLLNYLGLGRDTIEMIAETNPLKLGLLTPGTHIPIVSEDRFLEEMPEYALLLTWNYIDYFLEHSDYIRRGGRFIVPLPEPTIRP